MPKITGTAPPNAVLMASSLPTPFCSEIPGAVGLSSPAKARSARSVSTALTKRKSMCEPYKSRGRSAIATKRAGSSLTLRPLRSTARTTSALSSRIVTLQRAARWNPKRVPIAPAPMMPIFTSDLKLILQPEGVPARRMRDVSLPEEKLRARSDLEVSVHVDHGIRKIVDSCLKAEAVHRLVLAEQGQLRIENASGDVKVAPICLEQRVPRRIVPDRIGAYDNAGAAVR